MTSVTIMQKVPLIFATMQCVNEWYLICTPWSVASSNGKDRAEYWNSEPGTAPSPIIWWRQGPRSR